METAYFYFGLGILLVAFEILAPGFILAPLGIAAILTGIVAWFFEPLILHAFSFLIFCLAVFYGLRHWQRHTKVSKDKESRFGLVGQRGILIQPFRSATEPAIVKVFSDEFEVVEESGLERLAVQNIAPGTAVTIVEVIGNKVKIKEV
jgi:membrane protein implicated in regulation of membrane protease activity